MHTQTAAFMDALRKPHQIEFKATVWRAGIEITPPQYLDTGMPLAEGGNVTGDATQFTRRALSVTVAAPDLAPTDAQDLLAPYGTELKVYAGIAFPTSTEWCPLGVFPIQSAEATESGDSGRTGISIAAPDRAQYLIDARFTAIEQSQASSVVGEISRLVAAGLPPGMPVMVDLTGSSTACPKQAYDDKDRAGAVQKLATSINAELFFDADGVPTLRPVPDASTTPVWSIDAGEGGVMISAKRAGSREHIFNAIIASGSASDGTSSAFGAAYDTNPASPTYWDGPFGHKPAFFSSPVLTTSTQCILAATTMLATYVGAGWTIDLSSIPNYALDLGDVILAKFSDGTTQPHIVDGFTIPLDLSGGMPVTSRTNQPADSGA